MKLCTLCSGLAAITALSLTSFAMAEAPTSVKTEVKAKYKAKNFDHLIGNVKGLDDELLKMHFKLYQGYVTNVNNASDQIEGLNAAEKNRSLEYAGLKKLFAWEYNGMTLHEYYFANLGGKDPLNEKDPLFIKIADDFGSYDLWKKDFIATGAMRGIGWAIAYIEPKEGRLINTWINEHDLGHLAGGKPILVMDVFEHAYITQFALDRAKYIDVFFNNINWSEVSKRFQDVK